MSADGAAYYTTVRSFEVCCITQMQATRCRCDSPEDCEVVLSSSDYGGEVMGLIALMGFLVAVRLLAVYRTTRNKRYLRASAGTALLAASAIVYAFDDTGVLSLLLLLPAVYLVFKNLPMRRPFFWGEASERRTGAADSPKCTNCGYDLRGTLAAGIHTCPECHKRASDEDIQESAGGTRTSD